MEFQILGPLEVVSAGQVLELGGVKQRSLLAVLLLHANEVVSRERLIDALWEEVPPETAAKTLQVHISNLRKLLGRERVATHSRGYSLRVGEGELDLERFEHACEEGRFSDALALWHGQPLTGLEEQRFAKSDIARLEELRLGCLEARIEHDLMAGLHSEIIGELESLVREHPFRERLRGQLMLALYRSGRQAEALAVYQRTRETLVDGLGIEPSRELRDLHQLILNQDPALDLSRERKIEPNAPQGAFVGRDAELEELLGGLDAALGGHGRLFLIAGEAGIGKSRLADEVGSQARARGMRVLVGRCWEGGGAPAYWPWVQSLRAYMRELEPEIVRAHMGPGAADLAQILPELREILPGLPEAVALDSEGARFRVFDATAQFLRRASERFPLVLILDDLHAADTPSLLLLQFLVRELDSTHVLVLGALRDVESAAEPGPLAEMLVEVAREPMTRRLTLRGLTEQDIAQYLELTASEIASPALITALHEGTEGNPLFMGETVRLLAIEGIPFRTAEAPIVIPQTVREAIGRRLDHLSEECHRLLPLASVLGREFTPDVLARVAELSEDEVLEILDEAMQARVVSDVPGTPGRLRFAHVLIRDTLYEGLTTARRVRVHRLVVDALEQRYGADSGPHLAELAHHSIAGSDFDRGLGYARRAGDRALALLAYEEAARLYRLALDALDLARPDDDETRCELLLALGETEEAGSRPAAKSAFLDAAQLARRLGLPRELARAAVGYGGRSVYARAGGDPRTVPLLEEALAVLPEDDVELRVRLLGRLAGALRDEHSRDRRDRLSLEAVDLARRAGNPRALVYALDGRAAAILGPDTIGECLVLANELRDVAAAIGNTNGVVHGFLDRCISQVMFGEIAEAEVTLDELGGIVDRFEQPVQLFQVSAARAMLALEAGRLSDAERLISDAFVLGERAQPEMAIPIYWLQRFSLSELQGTLGDLESAIRDLVADHPTRPAFRCVLGLLQARVGNRLGAAEVLDELQRDDFSLLPFDAEWLYGMSLITETATILGDSESAPILYRLLAPWAGLNAANHPEGSRGSVSRYLGLLATTMKRWADAERHFHDALDTNERMGAWPWLAHTEADYARMLLARGESGDQRRADELRAQAIEIYQRIGVDTDQAATLIA